MKYKLIVMDIDDTLKEKNKKISQTDIQSIKLALGKGVKIALASGRPTNSIIKSLIEGGLSQKQCRNDLIIIGYNGSEAIINNNQIYSKTIDSKIAKKILLKSQELNANAAFFSKNDFYSLENNSWSRNYEKKLNYTQIKVKNSLFEKDKYFKIVVMQNPRFKQNIQIIDSYLRKIKLESNEIEYFRAKTQFTETSNPCEWIEIMPPGINKGYAVKKLSEILNIELSKIIVIGDGINDKEMIEIPEVYSIVMNNSKYEEIKKVANYISTDIFDKSNPGVSNAIKKLILN